VLPSWRPALPLGSQDPGEVGSPRLPVLDLAAVPPPSAWFGLGADSPYRSRLRRAARRLNEHNPEVFETLLG